MIHNFNINLINIYNPNKTHNSEIVFMQNSLLHVSATHVVIFRDVTQRIRDGNVIRR
jgi:hypothetical protein